MSSFPDTDRRYTMALASIIYDVLDDYIGHASIHKFLSSERAAALEHLKVLEDMGIHTDTLLFLTEAIILKPCSVTVSNMAISVS